MGLTIYLIIGLVILIIFIIWMLILIINNILEEIHKDWD